MLKQFFLIALFLSAAQLAFSQSDTTQKKHIVEVGINAGTLINNFIDFGATKSFINSPYVLTEKCIWDKDALRCGIGVSGKNSKFSSSGSSTPFTTNAYSFDTRIGYERQIPVTEKWLFYAGADLIFSYDQQKTVTNGFEDFVITTNTVSAGAGPIVGVQINFNKHIGLATEAVLYGSYGEASTRQKSSQFPEANSSDKTVFTSFDLNSPTSIIFTVRF